MHLRHLIFALMFTGSASAQMSGAATWFQPNSPQDAETAALLSYDMAVNFGLLKPHQTQFFVAPLLTPRGPQLPLDVLYREGMTEPSLPEHFKVLQDGLGLNTVIGGRVKGQEVTLLVQQGTRFQEVTVQAPLNDLRRTTLKKAAELLKTSLLLPKLAPKELAVPLQQLEVVDLLGALQPAATSQDPVAQAFYNSLLKPQDTLDRAYQAMLQNPRELLELDVSAVPGLASYQAILHEQLGDTETALSKLNAIKFAYAKTLREVIEHTHGKLLTPSWPPANRGVLTDAQAVVVKNAGGKVRDTREALARALPNSEYALLEYSFLAFDREDFQTARGLMERLVVLNPGRPLHWTNLGWAQYRTGNAQQAARSSQQALNLDPSDEIAAYNLGLYHVVLRNDTDAQSAYGYALNLGDHQDTLMALDDLRELSGPPARFYQGVLLEQLGNVPAATEAINAYLAGDLTPQERSNGQQILERLASSSCDFELNDAPWTVGAGGDSSTLKQGLYLQSRWHVRCGSVLPMPLTLQYTLSQNGEVYASEKVTPSIKPGTSGFTVNTVLVPLLEVKEGTLTSTLEVVGANGQRRTFTKTYQVAGQATLQEAVASSGVKFVTELQRTVSMRGNPVELLLDQFQTLLAQPERVKLLYPNITDAQLALLSKVDATQVEGALRSLLSRVGAEVGPGSEVFFPDEIVLFVLQQAQG